MSSLRKLFDVKKNQIERLRDRGYDISAEEPLFQYSFADFLSVYQKYATDRKISFREAMTRTYQNADGDKMLVYYGSAGGSKNVSIGTIRLFIQEMKDNNVKTAMLITDAPIGSQALDPIAKVPDYDITTFLDSELYFNPTKHILVPRHVKLTAEEAQEFYQRNRLTPKQMPMMSSDDVIAKYYGYKPGDVIRLERTNLSKSMLVDHSVSYRRVV